MNKNDAKKKKKRLLISTLAVAGVIVGGLTFAWYTSQDSATNTFTTSGSLKTVVVENFTPPTNWQPGTTTDKVVQVTNTGTVDAYVRVQLSELLTYYKKDSTSTNLSDIGDVSTTTYAEVDADAIEATINNWNGNNTDQYTAISDITTGIGKIISDSGYTLATANNGEYTGSGVYLYVKESTGTSKDSDGKTTETGENVSFIGYYVDEYGNAYELDIDTDNLTYTYTSAVGQDNKTVYTAAYGGTITLGLYGVTEVVVDDSSISDYVEIEFYDKDDNEDGLQSDWYYLDGYFYYNAVLASGASTTPLIKSVTLKDTVGDDVINATYVLTVNNDSTQAVDEAAAAVFTGESDDDNDGILNVNFDDTANDGDEEEAYSEKIIGAATNITDESSDFNNNRGSKTDADVSTETVTTTT